MSSLDKEARRRSEALPKKVLARQKKKRVSTYAQPFTSKRQWASFSGNDGLFSGNYDGLLESIAIELPPPTAEAQFITKCHHSLQRLRVRLIRTHDLPLIGWQPASHDSPILSVYNRAPAYILAHEVAHVWVAHHRSLRGYGGWSLPEFGLGQPSFALRATARRLPANEVEAHELAARTLGLLLLTRWFPGEPLAWRAHLKEGGFNKGQGLNSVRGARLLFEHGLIGLSPEGKVLLVPDGDSLDGALRLEPPRRNRLPPPR